jgi:hypothetical protein
MKPRKLLVSLANKPVGFLGNLFDLPLKKPLGKEPEVAALGLFLGEFFELL